MPYSKPSSRQTSQKSTLQSRKSSKKSLSWKSQLSFYPKVDFKSMKTKSNFKKISHQVESPLDKDFSFQETERNIKTTTHYNRNNEW